MPLHAVDPAADPAERRQHPRIELYATVEIKDGDEVLVLSVVNISLGGAYLSGDGLDLSRIPIGAEKDMIIFDEARDGSEMSVRGRVLRRDEFGVALQWVGDGDSFRVASFIDFGTRR